MSYKPTQALADKLSKAKALLVLDHPFFATTLLKKEIVWDEKVPTMAVNARGTIYLGPAFVEKLSTQQLIWGLAHECMHYMLLHPARKNWRKMAPWNWACDAVINDILDDAKVGERIPKTVDVPNARTQKAEDLYHEDDGQGNGGKGMGGDGMGEDLIDGGEMSDAEMRELEAQAKIDMVQARNVAKMQGKLPAGIERMVDEIVYVPTPWYTILERFMASFVVSEPTWSRPNRRHIHGGVYLPGNGKAPSMGEVVIAVDTSGSIGGPELAEFQGHLNAILDQCAPEKVTVLYCDAAVGSSDEYAPEDLPAHFKHVSGGGGTAFGPVFDYVAENDIEPDVLVYLTDGYGSAHCERPHYPTIWLTTGATEFPFGEVVEFKS